MIITYICPKCCRNLFKTGNQLKCPVGHSYDISSEGYVNLLLGNKRSGLHGDTKEMIRSRRRFLQLGLYFPIVDNLTRLISGLAVPRSAFSLLDAGCGEGYYAGNLKSALTLNGLNCDIYGTDVSKDAVKSAAKQYKDINFSVSSVNKLPFADLQFDFLLSLFAPLAEQEFFRVLKKGGYLITVSPGARHLWTLKEQIYDHPKENPPPSFKSSLFIESSRYSVSYNIFLPENSIIRDLFDMTPYRYNTSESDYKRLSKLDSLTTEASFEFCIFKKYSDTGGNYVEIY